MINGIRMESSTRARELARRCEVKGSTINVQGNRIMKPNILYSNF